MRTLSVIFVALFVSLTLASGPANADIDPMGVGPDQGAGAGDDKERNCDDGEDNDSDGQTDC